MSLGFLLKRPSQSVVSLSGLPSQGEGLPGQETLWWTPEPSNSSRHRIASDAYLGPKEVRADGRVVPVISNVCVDPSCESGYCPRCSKHPHPSTWCCWLLGNQDPPKQEGIGGINSLTSSTIKLHPLKVLQPFLKSLPHTFF